MRCISIIFLILVSFDSLAQIDHCIGIDAIGMEVLKQLPEYAGIKSNEVLGVRGDKTRLDDVECWRKYNGRSFAYKGTGDFTIYLKPYTADNLLCVSETEYYKLEKNVWVKKGWPYPHYAAALATTGLCSRVAFDDYVDIFGQIEDASLIALLRSKGNIFTQFEAVEKRKYPKLRLEKIYIDEDNTWRRFYVFIYRYSYETIQLFVRSDGFGGYYYVSSRVLIP